MADTLSLSKKIIGERFRRNVERFTAGRVQAVKETGVAYTSQRVF